MTVAIEILDVSGNPFKRGRDFGAARRVEIGSYVSDWLDSIGQAGIEDPRAYVTRMLGDTNFMAAIDTHAPELLEEVKGCAEGAGQPLPLVLASQLIDEEWAYRASRLRVLQPMQKCSSAAIHVREGLSLLGQNMDLGSYTEGHQVALRIGRGTGESGALVFTIGPVLALMGINAHGVGVCVNSLPQLPAAREGLPVAFVTRKLLQAKCAREAAQIVGDIPHATGQHYLISDPHEVRSFEASPLRVSEYRPENPARIFHTNHPLAEEQVTPAPPDQLVNTEARLCSLASRLMTSAEDVGAIKEALCSHDDRENPVCIDFNPGRPVSRLTGSITITTGSMVSILKSAAARLDSWISKGPPCSRGYTHIQLPTADPDTVT